jgi:hypothetical protein
MTALRNEPGQTDRRRDLRDRYGTAAGYLDR